MTNELLEKLRGDFQPAAYCDPYGVWRIGYGTRTYAGNGERKKVRPGDTCTQEQAEFYFRCDVAEAERAVNRAVNVPLTPHQYDALVMHVYRAGALRTTLKQYLNSGDTDGFLKALREEIRITDRKTKRRYVSGALAMQREEEVALFRMP
jgi:GH24 family phage-related lysozyme (muramidase)